jgi:ribosomal protein L1
MKVNEAITELKKEEKKFDQTVDLIINLRGIDVKRDSINAVFNVPHQVKKKKVCGFLSKKSGVVTQSCSRFLRDTKTKRA